MTIADPGPPAPYAPRNGVVPDPFADSGTSLVETARLGLPACVDDLNPAAVALARVYRLVNLDAAEPCRSAGILLASRRG